MYISLSLFQFGSYVVVRYYSSYDMFFWRVLDITSTLLLTIPMFASRVHMKQRTKLKIGFATMSASSCSMNKACSLLFSNASQPNSMYSWHMFARTAAYECTLSSLPALATILPSILQNSTMLSIFGPIPLFRICLSIYGLSILKDCWLFPKSDCACTACFVSSVIYFKYFRIHYTLRMYIIINIMNGLYGK